MITANFSAYGRYVTDSLTQWDTGQVLRVAGLNLSAAPEVHFSNANMDRAIVRQATLSGDVISVEVPGSLLQDPLRIKAHVCTYEGDTCKVIELVEIPVKPRKRPLDYVFEDTQGEVYSYKKLENMIENITETWFAMNAEQVQDTVTAWLDSHPEATTTVQDHSLSIDKMMIGALGYVTPEMFGAVGDGVADDTDALQAAVDAGVCMFGAGKTYLVMDMIVAPSGAMIDLNGATLLRGFGAGAYGTIRLSENSKIFNGTIDGNYAENSYGGMDYINHADVWLTGEHNEVYGVKFVDSMGEGVKVGKSYNSIHDCEFNDYADHAIYCKDDDQGTEIRECVSIYGNTLATATSTREAIKVSNGFDKVAIFANHAKLEKGWFVNVDNGSDGFSNGSVDIYDNKVDALYFMSVTGIYGEANIVTAHRNSVRCTMNVFKTPLNSTTTVRNGFSCKQLIFKDNDFDINAEYMFIFDMVDTGDVIIDNNRLRKSYTTGNPRMIYAYGSFDRFIFNGNTIDRVQTGDDKFNYPLFYLGNYSIKEDFTGNVFTLAGNQFLSTCSPLIQDGSGASGGCMTDCHIAVVGNVFGTVGSAGFRIIAPSNTGSLAGITKHLTVKNNISINGATIDTGSYPEGYITK